MIDTILEFFKKPEKQSKNSVPDGLCPDCWGHQEYDNMIREMYKDKQIDVNNHSANYAFIQDFVITHINGIKLKKGNNGYECPTCKLIILENKS